MNNNFLKINIKKFRKNNFGFLSVEVLVAISVIVLSVLSAVLVAQKSLVVSRQAVHEVKAGFLLEEGAEAMRLLRDTSWQNISNMNNNTNYGLSLSNNTWSLIENNTPIDSFTRIIKSEEVKRDDITGDIVSSGGTVDTGTKKIIITVSWQEGDKNISKEISFYLFDIFS